MKKKNLNTIEKLWKCFNNPFLYNFIDNISFTDLDELEQKIKALEIIKKKRVIINCIYEFDNNQQYNDWKHYILDGKEFELTQEEFDIVKKELEK